jgi:hypothetical protein
VKQRIISLIFWFAIIFNAITVFSLTIGQKVSYEFADYKVSRSFYDIIMLGFPVAILLTLFGSLKRENTKTRNGIIIVVTASASILCLAVMFCLIFAVGFGNWVTSTTIYRHKTENKVIKYQLYDIGAFGYGRHRVVEVEPILKYWILPTEVDTTKIDKNQWKYVNENGDIKW